MASSTRVLGAIVFVQLFLGCSLVYASYEGTGLWADFGSGLSSSYYDNSCPSAEGIISSFVKDAVSQDVTFAPAVLRLHFHDCMVHGCDASVLIDDEAKDTERYSLQNNNSIRGFDQVDQLKAQLEAACPRIVSCADILAVAARDAVVATGGESWPVGMGRKDGLVSSLVEANSTLPSPTFTHDELVANFAAQGLSQSDLVLLSGAHTIGRGHCRILVATNRIYNSTDSNAVNGADGDLDPTFAASLQSQCPPSSISGSDTVDLDPTNGGFQFDNTYYSRLLNGEAVFDSDHALLTDETSANLVSQEASNRSPFGRDFGNAMIRMGNIAIPNGDGSNIRTKCSAFNQVTDI